MAHKSIILKQELVIERLYTIHYQEMTNDYIFSGEKHAFWEFLHVDNGEVIVTAEKKRFKLSKDEVVFHKPDEFHAVSSNGEIAPNLIILSFDCNSPAMEFFKGRVLKLTSEERFLLGQIILEAKTLFSSPLNDPLLTQLKRVEEPPFGAEQMIKLLLEQFLLKLIRRNAAPSSALPMQTYTQKTDILYNQILSYIDSHIHTQLSLAMICQDNLVSYSQLYHMFREKHQCSVMKYVSERKITVAKQLIREQKLNFSQIADRLGFSSIHYFSRQFKKETGMTPTEYSRSAKMIAEEGRHFRLI